MFAAKLNVTIFAALGLKQILSARRFVSTLVLFTIAPIALYSPFGCYQRLAKSMGALAVPIMSLCGRNTRLAKGWDAVIFEQTVIEWTFLPVIFFPEKCSRVWSSFALLWAK
jgi:hypothetical protein